MGRSIEKAETATYVIVIFTNIIDSRVTRNETQQQERNNDLFIQDHHVYTQGPFRKTENGNYGGKLRQLGFK